MFNILLAFLKLSRERCCEVDVVRDLFLRSPGEVGAENDKVESQIDQRGQDFVTFALVIDIENEDFVHGIKVLGLGGRGCAEPS